MRILIIVMALIGLVNATDISVEIGRMQKISKTTELDDLMSMASEVAAIHQRCNGYSINTTQAECGTELINRTNELRSRYVNTAISYASLATDNAASYKSDRSQMLKCINEYRNLSPLLTIDGLVGFYPVFDRKMSNTDIDKIDG